MLFQSCSGQNLVNLFWFFFYFKLCLFAWLWRQWRWFKKQTFWWCFHLGLKFRQLFHQHQLFCLLRVILSVIILRCEFYILNIMHVICWYRCVRWLWIWWLHFSDGDDDSQSRSPLHQNGAADSGLVSPASNEVAKTSNPRPPKFHFADGQFILLIQTCFQCHSSTQSRRLLSLLKLFRGCIFTFWRLVIWRFAPLLLFFMPFLFSFEQCLPKKNVKMI